MSRVVEQILRELEAQLLYGPHARPEEGSRWSGYVYTSPPDPPTDAPQVAPAPGYVLDDREVTPVQVRELSAQEISLIVDALRLLQSTVTQDDDDDLYIDQLIERIN